MNKKWTIERENVVEKREKSTTKMERGEKGRWAKQIS